MAWRRRTPHESPTNPLKYGITPRFVSRRHPYNPHIRLPPSLADLYYLHPPQPLHAQERMYDGLRRAGWERQAITTFPLGVQVTFEGEQLPNVEEMLVRKTYELAVTSQAIIKALCNYHYNNLEDLGKTFEAQAREIYHQIMNYTTGLHMKVVFYEREYFFELHQEPFTNADNYYDQATPVRLNCIHACHRNIVDRLKALSNLNVVTHEKTAKITGVRLTCTALYNLNRIQVEYEEMQEEDNLDR